MAHVTPFTLRAVLRTDKANAKGLCPIAICVSVKGKRAYHSTGLRVLPAQWVGDRVQGHSNSAHYNAKIAKVINEAEADLLKTEVTDIRQAKQIVAGDRGQGSFIDYAESTLEDINIAPSTRRRWLIHLDHIRQYAPDLEWGQITPAWLTGYQRHIMKWMKPNTVRGAFVFIRRIFNEARPDITTLYPFRDWKLPKEEDTPKGYLTLDETDRIWKLLQDSNPNLSEAARCTIAHFLLECYAGIRHSDWGKWQTERLTDGESFYLTTTKTGEPIYLPLSSSPRLAKVVKYIKKNKMVYTQTNQDANKVLKMVGIMAKIKKKITTHTGRHSCAVMLLDKGFSKETVAEVLGVSMKIIDVYAKITRQKVRNEFERLGGL